MESVSKTKYNIQIYTRCFRARLAKVEQLGTQQWAANMPHCQPAAAQNTGRFVLAYPGPERCLRNRGTHQDFEESQN
jgi:hypothetical protein